MLQDLRWMTEEQIRKERMWRIVQIIKTRSRGYENTDEYLCLLEFKEFKERVG